MSVRDCIRAYHSLSREIFDSSWRPKGWKLSKAILGITADEKARSHRLEDAICRIIAEYLPLEERSKYMDDEGKEFCPKKVPLLVVRGSTASRCATYVVPLPS
jgi:hypothetical protein